ncbi:MAG: glycoside hydrolase, partial [Thermoplasmata archaeon]|nr:glycoside hydrolase [Thermoplasmata archaeon]
MPRSISVIVAIAAIMVLGSFAGLTLNAALPTNSTGSHLSVASHPAPRAVTPPGAAPSSGNGTFWLNTAIQNVSTNNHVCSGSDYYYYPPQPLCGQTNITNEPSLNLSSNGVLVTAYTAYTNWTPCEAQGYPLLANYTYTEIGISTSTDDGATWTTPQYLGNTVCTNATVAGDYIDSWQPTVTSLANGTLVAAWVEFNESSCYYCYGNVFPELSITDDDYNSSQLVVAFSYDNGTNWTAPTPINTSTPGGYYCPYYCRTYANWIQQRPSLTAFGQTIYLAWTNITTGWYGDNGYEYDCIYYNVDCPSAQGDSAVQLSVSLNGTANFSAPIQLPVYTTPGQDTYVAANPSALVTPNGTVVVAYMSNLSWNSSLPTREECETDYPYFSDCGGFLSDVLAAQSSNNGTNWTVGVAANGVYDARDYQAYIDQQDMYNTLDQINPAPKATYDPASQQVVIAYIGDVTFKNCNFPYGNICDPPYENGEFTMPDVYVANGSLTNNTWSDRLVTAWSGLGNATLNGLQDSYFYNPSIVSTSSGTIYLSAQFVNGSACTEVPAGSAAFYGAVDYCGEGLEIYGTSTDNGTTFTLPGDVDTTGEWYSEMPAGLQSSMVAAGNQVWIAWTQTTCSGWEGANRSQCEWGQFSYGPLGSLGGYNSNTTVVVSRLFLGTGITVTFQETGLPVGQNWSVDFSGVSRSGPSGSSLSVSGVPAGSNQTWNGSIISIGPGARYYGTPSVPSPGNFTGNSTITWTYVLQYTLTISTIPAYPSGAGAEEWFEGGEYCIGEYYNEYAFDPSGECSDATSINYNLTPGPGTVWANAGTPFHIQALPLNGSMFWSDFFCTGCDWEYVNLSFEAWTGTGVGSYNGTANATTVTLGGPVNETASFGINAYCVWEDTPAWTSNCASSGLTVQFQETGLPTGDRWGVSVWSTGLNQTTPYPAFTTQSSLAVKDPALSALAYFEAYTVPSSSPGEVWAPTADPASPLLGPLDGASTLHYALASVDSTLFTSTVRAVGLPNDTAWSYSVNGVGTGVNGASANLTLNGGSQAIAANPVYLDNGVGYQATAIDIQPFVINETWSNVSSSSTTYAFNGSASIT